MEAVLVNFLVFERLVVFPLCDSLWLESFAGADELGILGDRIFECFELSFDLMAFLLLLNELSLKLRCHFIVPVLSLFKIKADLVYVR